MFAQISLCLVLVTGTLGHMMGHYNWGNGMMQNQNQQQGWGMHQQMGNNWNGMSALGNLLGMNMNMNNMRFNNMEQGNMNMGGNMGTGGNMGGGHGMMGNMMRMFLMTLQQMGNRDPGNQGGHRGDDDDHDISREDYDRLEDLLKWEFTKEVAHYVVVYQEYMEKMGAFKGAVEGLCLGIDAYIEYAKQNNMTENATLDNMADDAIEKIGEIDERDQKVEELVKYLNTMGDVFDLAFFKVATMVCKSGGEYLEAYEKMEKMEKGGGDCDKKK